MRHIDIASVEIEHYRSYRARQTITFPKVPALYYLTGMNKAEPRLGSNGAGKSSLWEAAVWCLTGFASNGDRAADVVSWGAEQPRVIVHLLIDGREVLVERIGSPNKLFIDRRPVEQSNLDKLLGLNRPRFLQSVIFGQFTALFLDLSISERGQLLDDVLALEYWVKLADVAADRVNELAAEITEVGKQLSRTQGALDELSDEAELRERAAAWTAQRKADLDHAINQVAAAEIEQEELQRKLDAALRKPQREAPQAATGILDLTVQIRQMEQEQQQLSLDAQFYRHHTVCPTCHQDISAEFIKEALEDIADKAAWLQSDIAVKQVELGLAKKRAEEQRREAEKVTEQNSDIRAEIRVLRLQLHAMPATLDKLVARAEAIGEDTNPYQGQLARQKERRAELERDRNRLNRSLFALRAESEKATYWKAGFKRVRLFKIRQILRSLELEVVAAAAALGLVGWKVAFATETETRSGTIKSGVQVLVSSPKSPGVWSKWSGGEGQRIAIAVNIGLSNLIQRHAGVSFGFEVWDEPIKHLSPPGIEDLLAVLDYRAQTTHKKVWIADQVATTYAGFGEIWQAVKDENGTTVHRL